MLHEYDHELAHQGGDRGAKPLEQREFEAEAIGYVVAPVPGIENRTSRDYLLTYHATAQTLRDSLGTIQVLVRRVLAIVAPRTRQAATRPAA
jgi:hypothetical protein